MPAAEAQRDSQATIGVNFYCGFGTQGASDNLIQLPFQLQFPRRICSKQNYAIVAAPRHAREFAKHATLSTLSLRADCSEHCEAAGVSWHATGDIKSHLFFLLDRQ
jgi:hypothetical protein